jgi:hypothetical protein
MPGHRVEALETLRLELKLVELGVYGARTAGRPLSIFEDSPICPRYRADPCPECVLMKFVPLARRWEAVPCHHIRLNDAHETIDSLSRTGTQEELERALRKWLHATIEALEAEQVRTGEPPTRSAT